MVGLDHRPAQDAAQQLHVGVLFFPPAYHQLAHAGDGVGGGLVGRRRVLRRLWPLAVNAGQAPGGVLGRVARVLAGAAGPLGTPLTPLSHPYVGFLKSAVSPLKAPGFPAQGAAQKGGDPACPCGAALRLTCSVWSYGVGLAGRKRSVPVVKAVPWVACPGTSGTGTGVWQPVVSGRGGTGAVAPELLPTPAGAWPRA